MKLYIALCLLAIVTLRCHAQPTARSRVAAVAAHGSDKYLDVQVCKGFCNQLMSFFDAAALAYTLNITLVLPEIYRHYDTSEQRIKYPSDLHHNAPIDLQKEFAVPFSTFFDEEKLIAGLAGKLRVVARLPDNLQGDTSFARLAVVGADASQPHLHTKYVTYLSEHRVLRLGCVLNSMQWTTKDFGELRAAIYRSLEPSAYLQKYIQAHKRSLSPEYTVVHVRSEPDWKQYCQEEAKNPEVTGIQSFAMCYYTAEQVVTTMQDYHVNPAHSLYIASGDPSVTAAFAVKYQPIHMAAERERLGLLMNSSRDVHAAVDWFMSVQADRFFGNLFSSFTFMVHEARLMRRGPSAVPQTVHYNAVHTALTHDVDVLETKRFRMHGGIMPTRSPGGHAHGKGLGAVRQIVLDQAVVIDSGAMIVKGWVESATPFQYHDITVHVEQKGKANATDMSIPDVHLANRLRSDLSPGQFGYELSFFLPQPVVESEFNVTICTTASVCTPSKMVYTAGALQRTARSDAPVPILYVDYMGGVSGGPEALHQLSAGINQLYSEGRILLRSAVPNGNDVYLTPYSWHTNTPLRLADVTPFDYFVTPEVLSHGLPNFWSYVMDEVGLLPFVWHIGQHTTDHSIDLKNKPGHAPLCLCMYYARLHDCPPKAVLNTPMAAVYHEEAQHWRTTGKTPKEDVVVFDPDYLGNLDITRIKLPPGAKLVGLQGFNRSETVDLYKRAKVLLDTYITGMERAIFESSLFDVVIITADHAVARDMADYPFPNKWKWKPWDYEDLNRKLASALSHYDDAVVDFRQLREYTVTMPSAFLASLEAYFADDVHVMVPVASTHDHSLAMLTAIMMLQSYPFATFEFVCDNPYYFEYEYSGLFHYLRHKGYMRKFKVTPYRAEYKRFGWRGVYMQPPEIVHRRKYVLVLSASTLLHGRSTVQNFIQVAERHNSAFVLGPGGLALINAPMYYPIITSQLHLIQSLSPVSDVVAMLRSATHVYSPHKRVLLSYDERMTVFRCSALQSVTNSKLVLVARTMLHPRTAAARWLNKLTQRCQSLQTL